MGNYYMYVCTSCALHVSQNDVISYVCSTCQVRSQQRCVCVCVCELRIKAVLITV